MARPASTYHQTLSIHTELLAAFGPGARMHRNTFDAVIMRALCCGDAQAANIARGGEKLGLWRRGRTDPKNPGSQGWVELNPTPEAA